MTLFDDFINWLKSIGKAPEQPKPQENTETLPTIELIPISDQQPTATDTSIIPATSDGEKVSPIESFISQPETVQQTPIAKPQSQPLKGGSPYNASVINQLSPTLYELTYSGVGVGWGGYRGDSTAMQDAANKIQTEGQNQLDYWQNIEAQNAKGAAMSRCKSGAIATRENCIVWQNGLDHELTDAEISEQKASGQNMIDDAATIRSYVA